MPFYAAYKVVSAGLAGGPSGEIASKIDEAFGSLDEFKKQFSTAGATQFGSGWAWLVKKSDGKLGIEKTPNAQTPFHLQGMVGHLPFWSRRTPAHYHHDSNRSSRCLAPTACSVYKQL